MSQNQYKIGQLSVEGKTKRIYSVLCNPNECIVESKNAITANDDPKLTREFGTKAKAANITTCNVFNLLKKAGIPVSFKNLISGISFLSDNCTMVPLEVVARRYAVGSYLKREPSFKMEEGEVPYEFNDLCVEFFLKTTGGKCFFSNKELISGLTVEDQYISNPSDPVWRLLEPKVPYTDDKSFLSDFDSGKILNRMVSIETLTSITKRVFIVLEEAFSKQNIRLIDFKIEFGINSRGELVVSDVIDNDSWRIVTTDWEDLSKQSFRDGEDLSTVEKKYLQVMEITNSF